MSELAIEVSGLAKAYPIFDRPEHRLLQMLSRGRRRYYKEFWALRGVDLAVRRGETVGVIGTNGSGKSTLLQMICGSLTPTAGDIRINGAISALLELGTGFNPEFTGRENVFLNSSILGRSEAETRSRISEIEAFADIGEFIDRPVKTYSSGMYARLAFAVAIHVDPDILIVDEILSVGDAPFARKCFARIDQLKRGGGTILFVSHNTSQILDLCDRALVLHKGATLFFGETREAVSYYQKLAFAPAAAEAQVMAEIRQQISRRQSADGTADAPTPGACDAGAAAAVLPPGSADAQPEPERPAPAEPLLEFGEGFDPGLVSASSVSYPENGARIAEPRLLSASGAQVNILRSGRRYRLQYRVGFSENAADVRFGTFFKTLTGVELGGVRYPAYHDPGLRFTAGETVMVELEFDCRLGRGTYFLNCGVSQGFDTSLHRIIDALVFNVEVPEPGINLGTIDFGFQGQVHAVAGDPSALRGPASPAPSAAVAPS